MKTFLCFTFFLFSNSSFFNLLFHFQQLILQRSRCSSGGVPVETELGWQHGVTKVPSEWWWLTTPDVCTYGTCKRTLHNLPTPSNSRATLSSFGFLYFELLASKWPPIAWLQLMNNLFLLQSFQLRNRQNSISASFEVSTCCCRLQKTPPVSGQFNAVVAHQHMRYFIFIVLLRTPLKV